MSGQDALNGKTANRTVIDSDLTPQIVCTQ